MEKRSNKSAGTAFEKEFAELLAEHWFWVHIFQDKKNGQPCDIIAARSGNTYLFDCKDCQTPFFMISRMEENQYNAMKLFHSVGNEPGGFAIRFQGGSIYLIDYVTMKELEEKNVKRINESMCRSLGIDMDDWLTRKDQEDGWAESDEDHHWE